jgi:hypothetical protein
MVKSTKISFSTFLLIRSLAYPGVSSGENADLDPEDIYEVLVGATADGTSISTLCDRSGDSSSGTNVLRHLRTKFDLDTVKIVENALLQEYTLNVLPGQVEIVVDLHLRPYYGDEATDGTIAFHAYAALYARVRNKRYTLAVSHRRRQRHRQQRPRRVSCPRRYSVSIRP